MREFEVVVGVVVDSLLTDLAPLRSIGAITAIASNLATRLKFVLRIDESLDVFALHGVGGGVGCALTALFGSASIVSPEPGLLIVYCVATHR